MIIVDVQDEIFQNNNLFNKSLWSRYIGTELWGRLYDLCEKKNIGIVTADLALKKYADLSNCSLVSIEITDRTKELISRGVRPEILTSAESPIFAWEFYVNLCEYGLLFNRLMLPKGVINFAPEFEHKIFQTSFPLSKNICSNLQKYDEWNTRKRVCAIVSNRVWRPRSFRHLYQALRNPAISSSLYGERNKAIINMSKTGLVDLYGRGWDKYVIGGNLLHYLKLKKLWKGKLDIKDSGMSNYKFSICYENTDFPGYVTEKIFDSLAAGTIPIYFGSEHVKDILPSELYIDVKQFDNISDISEYIDNFSFDDYQLFYTALTMFCKSRKFKMNTYEAQAENILNIMSAKFNLN